MLGFKSYSVGATFENKDVFMTLTASTVSTTESQTKTVKAGSLFIEAPASVADPIVNGSLLLQMLDANYTDSFGQIKRGAQAVGSIDYRSGLIALSNWDANKLNSGTVKSMIRGANKAPVYNLVFKTPVTPLKAGSLSIKLNLLNNETLNLSTNAQGEITGSPLAHGFVDFKLGVVLLYFYEILKVADNPDIVNQPWYDAAAIYVKDGVNYINRPVYIDPKTVRYNAMAYTYLPLDKELIGLDPVRLPTDGRVPFVRKGDSVAITELKTMQLATNEVGDSFDLGFERLSDVSVVDSTGKRVINEQIDVDLDAGTIVLNGLFDAPQYTPPLTAKYRIMDMGLVIETDISGKVTLSTPITHDYTTDAILSSMLIAGDMQARAYNVFSQKTWGGVWSDTLIGEAAVIQLQTANNPIVVTNKDAITEQWALVFTGTNTFKIIGRTLGQIGTGDTVSRTAPINPQTMQPYFVIEAAAWGGGGAAGNAIRLNTQAAAYPLWLGNAIGQHTGSSHDNYDFTIGYHANIDRERGE